MTDRLRIVAIGDSITYGFPYLPQLSWVNLAGQTLGVTILNKGINGDTTAGMLARFNSDVLNYAPSHVIIMGGTNDAFAGVEAEEVSHNMAGMVNKASLNGIVPVVGIPVPCIYPQDESILALYRTDMRQYAAEGSLPVIDFYAYFLEHGSGRIKAELYADIVHPNEEGYRAMSTVAAAILGNLIK